MKALLVYPEMPPTYWSMRYALPFLGRKAAFPPLGLLTVTARLPTDSDLLVSVRAIQRKGLEVSGGFILGFDADREDIFGRQIRFIKEAAIERLLTQGFPHSFTSR